MWNIKGCKSYSLGAEHDVDCAHAVDGYVGVIVGESYVGAIGCVK